MFKNLISAEQLHTLIACPDVVVVDCRFDLSDAAEGERLYHQSHIPGAYYLHLNQDLSAAIAEHGGRHPLPDIFQFSKKLESLGIGANTTVVAYDDSRLAYASRLWWLLRYIGHDRVKVLEGGWSAWCNAHYAVDNQIPLPPLAGKLQLEVDVNRVVTMEAVKAMIGCEQTLLIDSREQERYLGIHEPIDPIAGHIDTAVNYPWQAITTDKGYFKQSELQQKHWTGVTETKDIVVYCGSGVTACVNLLSLDELGRSDAKLYAGSWSDWCSYLSA